MRSSWGSPDGSAAAVAGTAGPGAADAGVPDLDADLYSQQQDQAAADASPSDAADKGGCGGSRTLTPKPVQRGNGLSCGKGCRQVTFGNDVELNFEVKDDLIVYTGGLAVYGHVYLVDLKADKEWLVKKISNQDVGCSAVATDGNRLAYACPIMPGPDPPSWTVFFALFDPATNVENDLKCFKVFTAQSACPPRWMGLGNNSLAVNMSPTHCKYQDAYLYRFSDGSFTNLSNKKGGVWQTRMSGSRIVWTEAVKNTQIMCYDTVTGAKKMLDPDQGGQFHPRIEGDQVVWVDHRNAKGDMWDQGNSDIYLHDLKTQKTVAVTTQAARQDHPDVWGDWVVWEDWRNNPNPTPKYSQEYINSDIYAKNITTGQVVQLTSFKDLELQPQVDNGRVFFRMYDGKQLSLFMIDLKERLK